MPSEHVETARHEDLMQKLEDLEHQLDLMNQNLSGLAMIFAAMAQTMNLVSDKMTVRKASNAKKTVDKIVQ